MPSLVRVAHDEPRLDRLLQLYMHEWSALVPTAIGADARYVYPTLSAWADQARHAAYLLLDADDRPLGFALVAIDDDGVAHVEEFFVIAGARRHGVGATAAHALFATHAGAWSWTVRPENPAALAFWKRIAPTATVTAEPGRDGVVRTRMRLETA
jgi:predicted acetyltransferase